MTFLFDFIQYAVSLHSSNCHESSTYMTSVGKWGAGVPAKGLTPAHCFPLEGTVVINTGHNVVAIWPLRR